MVLNKIEHKVNVSVYSSAIFVNLLSQSKKCFNQNTNTGSILSSSKNTEE